MASWRVIFINMTNGRIEKYVGRHVRSSVPAVSVIIPAYNVASFVAETLDSVKFQVFNDYEIILINDGSPDTEDFESVVQPFLDSLIYLKQKNQGASVARNSGIECSRGKYLAFLDGDDIWFPEFLDEQVRYLEENGFDMVYSDAELFGEAFEGQTFMKTAPSRGPVTMESVLNFSCNIILSGSIARKEAVLEAGMFEPRLMRAMDFNLWLKMLHGGARIGYQKKTLLKYRIRGSGISGSSVERAQRELESIEEVSRSIELNDVQRDIVRNQRAKLSAALEVERGKAFLLQRDFAAAKASFKTANQFRNSSYLWLIIACLSVAPRLLLKIYNVFRRDEITLVTRRD